MYVCDKPQSQIDLNEPSRWQRVSLDIELGSDSGCAVAVASGCGADFDFGFAVCGTAWLGWLCYILCSRILIE